jgi:hypothetical protein
MSDPQTEAAQQNTPSEAPAGVQEATTEQAQGFDASQLMERFTELQGTVQDMAGQLQQAQTQEPAFDEPYPAFDQYGNPLNQEQGFDPNDPQQLQQFVQQNTQQALQPIQQQLYAREFNDLVGRYPDIKDQQTQQAVLGSLQAAGYDPNTMIPIPVIEMAYKAHRADTLASQQTPASEGGEAVLEQSGAQVPEEQQDMAAMILQAARGQQNTISPR